MSRVEFEARFPDDAACAAYLAGVRWPTGFVCPECGVCKGWELQTKRFTWECAGCHRQTSVTAGTIMHGAKIGLKKWFTAIHLVASHSNGISALQLQAQLGLGSYETAWGLLHKIRRALVDPQRTRLAGLVEVDEASIPHRTKDDPIDGGQGRSHVGKLLLVGAAEVHPTEDGVGYVGRIRLATIEDYSGETLRGFIEEVIAPGSTVVTDGLQAYRRLTDHAHERHVVGSVEAHLVLPWVHRVFSNLKRWLLGTFHGARRQHLQRYLDEFVFRWNRRRFQRLRFDRVLGLAAVLSPATVQDFVQQRV